MSRLGVEQNWMVGFAVVVRAVALDLFSFTPLSLFEEVMEVVGGREW